jgi:hypothetical protein
MEARISFCASGDMMAREVRALMRAVRRCSKIERKRRRLLRRQPAMGPLSN